MTFVLEPVDLVHTQKRICKDNCIVTFIQTRNSTLVKRYETYSFSFIFSKNLQRISTSVMQTFIHDTSKIEYIRKNITSRSLLSRKTVPFSLSFSPFLCDH